MKLIRPREEARERGDARRVGGLHPKRWALADMPGQALDLILARLDEGTLRRIAATVATAMDWDEAAVSREIASCRQR